MFPSKQTEAKQVWVKLVLAALAGAGLGGPVLAQSPQARAALAAPASRPQAQPSLKRLVELAAQPETPGCYGNVYCVLRRDLPSASLDDRAASGAWAGDSYQARLDVWWSRDGRGLLLLDWNYSAAPPGCGDWPCGSSDLYVHRYVNGRVVDEKFSRIGVPYRLQPWSAVKPGLPPAVLADASARVQAFRRAAGAQGEVWLDVELPDRLTDSRVSDLKVFVTNDESRLPIYRLRWNADRGVFVPARL
ncbi:hypothetical protein [Deinococcus sp. Marseille-Q6407]|uniref:hypothetical protein n=1 Tax=Deinococcus sp. Marseille-Q6407 TaxID=2969223 RepID=UPI0021C0A2BD|nr:hypothetical protein [Deinococcus sp. Marseille-Q6407]